MTEGQSGSIVTGGVQKLLLELHRRRVTGLLELYAGHQVHRVALRRGDPIHASAGTPPWRLGEVLVHLGVPLVQGAEHLPPALTRQQKRVGEAWVAAGVTSATTIERALREQLRLRTIELLALDQGRYRLFTGASSLEGLPRQPTRWTAPSLIAAARRRQPSTHSRPRGELRACDPGELQRERLRATVRRLERSDDPLAALGLPPDAGASRVRAAFRALALEHHPDRLSGVSDPLAIALHHRAFDAAVKVAARARDLTRG